MAREEKRNIRGVWDYCGRAGPSSLARDWGSVGNQGRSFDLPHLFVFHVDADGLIDRIAGYWDSALFFQQLGRFEID